MVSPHDFQPPVPSSVTPQPSPDAPLSAAMQQRIKILLQEVKGALQRHQLSPEVEAEIASLVCSLELEQAPDLVPKLLTEAIAHKTLSPQAQKQVQTIVLKHLQQQRASILVERVRDALQNEALSDKVQTELSLLLSLLPHASNRPDLIDEFDLAISALINPIPADQPRNLRFSRNLRKQLAVQLQQNPNPLWSIASAAGSSHNRLVAGLSWFLVVFTIVPTIVSAIFFVSGVTRQYNEIQDLQLQLANTRDQLAADASQVANLTSQLNTSRQELVSLQKSKIKADPLPPESLLGLVGQQQEIQQQLQASLTQTQTTLNGLTTQLRSSLLALRSDTGNGDIETLRTSLDNQLETAIAQLNRVQAEPILQDGGAESLTIANLGTQMEQLQAELDAVDQSLTNITTSMAEAVVTPSSTPTPTPTPTPTATSIPTPAADTPIGTSNDVDTALLNLFSSLIKSINNVNFPLILAVVATGALGSFVSVIVRANEFIDREQKAGLDLFLVGFFRPIVGMAFAFFLVAVLESGILSGFLAINTVKPDKKIYLYVAIAFVAGFSERLVKDIVGQTASMVGPKE